MPEWIPALEGVEEKLRRGARVADVGCGHGASTVVMAQAYPASRFHGFDFHDRSVEVARRRAEAAGVQDRLTFEVAPATAFPGEGYDLVTHFDCQAGEARIGEVVREAGFTRFRRATETPFNLIIEARA